MSDFHGRLDVVFRLQSWGPFASLDEAESSLLSQGQNVLPLSVRGQAIKLYTAE